MGQQGACHFDEGDEKAIVCMTKCIASDGLSRHFRRSAHVDKRASHGITTIFRSTMNWGKQRC
ncbi:hypothetical protein WI44_32080 [Burkholderia cepacia]|uniref:hypothetical protein n=1 Tax=Burkholderia cepacia TaxID=292 RepID=UPI000759A50B|nr:hypothetical protein [Burkholderia cepacia]KVA23129.1 hypothetical protein WI44_32080 [Burkholderia cepacia]